MKSNNIFKPVLGLLLIISFTMVTFAHNPETEEILENNLTKLQEALNKHNFGLVENQFHEDFSYEGINCGGHCSSARQVAAMIISDYPHKIKNLKVKEWRQEGPDVKVVASFLFEDNETAEETFTMTHDGKFLEMKLPRIKLMFGTPKEEKKSSCSCK